MPNQRHINPTAGRGRRLAATLSVTGCLCGLLALAAIPAQASSGAFISAFSTTTTLASTPPANGDQNPYGIVVVPRTVGKLRAGNILVSNFNNEGPTDANGNPTTGGNQGEGTTIVQFNSDGSNPRLFAQIDPSSFPGGVGLTTALSVLPNGDVVVGNLPTTDGTSATMTAGGLIVLGPEGRVISSISGAPINGPWDMTEVSFGRLFAALFVTNVLNGTVAASPTTVNNGTVVRIDLLTLPGLRPIVIDERVIANGFAERTDPAALVVGPTGVGLGRNDTLYVADTNNNRIAAIPNALIRMTPATGGGQTVSSGGAINGPLGLTIAPNGDVLTTNGGDGNLVETTPGGMQIAQTTLDSTVGAGALFGLTVPPAANGVLYVDDGNNTLRLLH